MFSRGQKRNLIKHFNRYSKEYKVFTREVNEFKEVIGDIFVREIKGIFYNNTAKVSRSSAYKVDKTGVTTEFKTHYLLVLDIKEVTTHMYIYVDDKRYEIINIEDEAGLGVSWILKLKEADEK